MSNLTTKERCADALFSSLVEDFPAPWSLDFHHHEPHRDKALLASVSAANGEIVIYLETFTGDGDRFNLGDFGALAITDFVNSMHEISQCPTSPIK